MLFVSTAHPGSRLLHATSLVDYGRPAKRVGAALLASPLDARQAVVLSRTGSGNAPSFSVFSITRE
jgi:hypothetical protein